MSLGMFGQYTSQQTRTLASLNSTKYPDTNKNFEQNVMRLNASMDYVLQYLQVMQKGVDQATQDPISSIRNFATDFLTLLGGGELLYGINFGDLQYFLPAIGALLGFDINKPFPLNLFEAAEHLLLGYIVPLDSWPIAIEGVIDGWLIALGFNQDFIDAVHLILDNLGRFTNDLVGIFNDLTGLLGVFDIFNFAGGPIGAIWKTLSSLLANFNVANLGSIANPFLQTLTPWLQLLGQIIGAVDDFLEAFTAGIGGGGGTMTNPLAWLTDFLGMFGGFVGLGTGSPSILNPANIPIFGPIISIFTGGTDIQGLLNFANMFNSINFLDPNFNPLKAISDFFIDIINQIIPDISHLFGGDIIDAIFNAINPGANASGVSLGSLTGVLAGLVKDVETGINLATRAFDVTATFGGILHQLMLSLPVAPIYNGFEHFLEEMLNVIATTVGSIFTSLSPQNPPIVAQQGQINAILAHGNSGTSGINYLPTAGVPLSANYPGTSNPSFTAPTGFSLPTVNTLFPNDFLQDTAPHIGVFTGNPSNLGAPGHGPGTDHGLATDKVHIEINPFINTFGTVEIFMCGDDILVPTQYVSLRIANSGPTVLSIVTYTGPNTGPNVRATVTLPATGSSDIVAMEYDNANNYMLLLNGLPVSGGAWADGGLVISHGPGKRECGIVTAQDGNGSSVTGAALKRFVAYDI